MVISVSDFIFWYCYQHSTDMYMQLVTGVELTSNAMNFTVKFQDARTDKRSFMSKTVQQRKRYTPLTSTMFVTV